MQFMKIIGKGFG